MGEGRVSLLLEYANEGVMEDWDVLECLYRLQREEVSVRPPGARVPTSASLHWIDRRWDWRVVRCGSR